MKVWKVNDYEWWAGADLESVKAACIEAWGEAAARESWEDGEYPQEIDPATLGGYPIADVPEDIEMTMADVWREEIASGDTTPRLISAADA